MTQTEVRRDRLAPQYDIEVRRDVRIPSGEDGVTLSADLYLPATADPVPAVVTGYPYRKDLGITGHHGQSQWLAARGYACLVADLRGIGSSDGTARPKNHPGEGDDMAAIIEWAAAQSWSSGAVGAWGASAGGVTTLRVGTRPPAALKAIIPLITPLDPAREAFYHDGARVDLHQRIRWAGSQLVEQLLPPLINHNSAVEQRRWRHRLYETEPHLVDLSLPADDPVWQERAIDPALIRIPTLAVGGWRDLYADAMVRAYEGIRAPKKLIIGPWMHTSPENSPFEPIDFLAVAVRWWDYWLRGIDNGIMDEPPVAIYTLGDGPGWQGYQTWPPADGSLLLSTGVDGTLRAGSPPVPAADLPVMDYLPDPTVGTLSGLWGIPSQGIGLPLDQHDDDMRALSVTSEELTEALLICGRAEVTVQLSPTSPPGPQRIVIRLADVDPMGRSTFITAGVICPMAPADEYHIVLRPIAYRLAAGHRLRVVLSDSDFPRLTPLPEPSPISVSRIEICLPTAGAVGAPVSMPAVEMVAAARMDQWTITRDPVHDGVEVVLTKTAPPALTGEGHLTQTSSTTRSQVRRAQPEAASYTGSHETSVQMSTGENVKVAVAARCTQTSYWIRGELSVDGDVIFSRSWDMPMTPEGRQQWLEAAQHRSAVND